MVEDIFLRRSCTDYDAAKGTEGFKVSHLKNLESAKGISIVTLISSA